MLVADVMTTPGLRLSPDASVYEAAQLLASSEASDLMVAGEDGRLVGVLSEGDLIRAVLPDTDEILQAGGSVHDAMHAFVRKADALSARRIAPLVITDPLTVSPTDHLAVVSAILVDRQIRRLPVVKDGRLVGTVSRSDVCRAVLGAEA